MAYQIRHRTHNQTLLHTINPENLHFVMNLDMPHDITYQISLDNPVIQEANTSEGDPFGAYQTDWQLLRDGRQVPDMRGMITSINIPADEEYVELTGKSWMHYLDRRHYPFDPINPEQILFRAFETDMASIIHDIIATVQARPYSLEFDLSELAGMPPTFDENVQIDFADTETIYSKLTSWAEGKPGFDFSVDENKVFHMYYPEYSDPTTIVWNFVTGLPPTLKRSSSFIEKGISWTDSGPAGTHIVGIGAGLANQLGEARGSIDGQQQFRRLDFTQDFGTVANRNKLRRLTDGALTAAVRPQREVPMKIAPEDIEGIGFWDKFYPGVYFVARAELGAHTLGGVKKLTAIDCTVTNEGEELIELHSTLWKAWFNVDNIEAQV